MSDAIAGSAKSKADAVADAVNRCLSELTIRCAREDGVRPYFDVGVISYGATVAPAFEGALAGSQLVSISAVADAPLRVEERAQTLDDGAGGLTERLVKFPVWFDVQARGATPMAEAFDLAVAYLEPWAAAHQPSFPPVVLNITDGEATGQSPAANSKRLRAIATQDGDTLLFNLHISGRADSAIAYPGEGAALPDEYAQQLFGMSSVLPGAMQELASTQGYEVSSTARGFLFNGDIVSVVRFLEIGTRAQLSHLR